MVKSHSHCKKCCKKITYNYILNYDKNENTYYKKYGNIIEYFCIQCNKNFNLSEKIIHINHLIIPNCQLFKKEDIIYFFEELRQKLVELKNEINLLKESKLNNQFKENHFFLAIRGKEKQESQLEYIDEMIVLGEKKQVNKAEERDSITEELKQNFEKIKTSKVGKIGILNANECNNEIECIDQIKILSKEKEPLYIDYVDYLSIEVDRNLRSKMLSKNYIIEREYSIEISREKESLKNVVVSKNNSFMIFSNNNRNVEKIINEEKKKVKELIQKMEKYEKYSNN